MADDSTTMHCFPAGEPPACTLLRLAGNGGQWLAKGAIVNVS